MRCAIPWLACIGALLQLAAPAALAQTAERPTIQPGDRWRFVVYYAVPATAPDREWVDGTVAISTYWYAAARAVVRWELDNPYLGRSNIEMVSAP